jgi:hypothetical protein
MSVADVARQIRTWVWYLTQGLPSDVLILARTRHMSHGGVCLSA